ncbi:MAG: hypothetical protein IKM04_08470 [Clostridia bacterium]|nr:hypothetical protein [Clostridia bacterium]
MSRYSLDGRWYIHDDPESLGFEAISSATDGFIAATVPGNIQGDLQDARILPPFRYGAVDERYYAVAMKDWWYKKEFILPKDFVGKRLTLEFEGVDYSCEIWLNGEKVYVHEGMFERFFFDVTDSVRSGKNELFVRIEKMPEEFLEYIIGSDGAQSGAGTPYHFVTGNNVIRNRLKGLKSPANLSYDWGSNMYTLGIWRSVNLCATGDVRIDWMQVKPSVDLDGKKASAASVTVNLECDSVCDGEVKVKYTVSGPGVSSSLEKTFAVKKGQQTLSAEIDCNGAELWWPIGYGDQPLYTVTAEVIDNDCAKAITAFRDVKWVNCEGVPDDFEFKYQLVLNGTPIRLMGSNYETPDLMFGRQGKRAEHYVKMAARCNMNFLRLHGGSSGHNDAVFDAADRYGIMLSVEYPIGNCCIENDDELMDRLDITYVNFIKQFRNHPSIIEWGGGNELEWWFRPNEDRTAMYRQEKATYSADDTRLFRYTCPVPGSRHSPWTYIPDWHYKMYNLDDMGDNFKIAPNMRFGEFGVQTPSNIDVWYKDIPEPDRWPLDVNNPVLIRKNAVNSVFDRDTWFCLPTIEALFGKQDRLEDAIKAGQFLGWEGLRYAFGQLRANDRRIGGMANWDYNEPWPNAAGSYLVDYDGRPVMMYWGTKEALEPISIQLKYEHILYEFIGNSTAFVQVVSDRPDFNEELEWSCVVYDRNGNRFVSESGPVLPEYLTTKTLAEIPMSGPENTRYGPNVAIVSLKNSNGDVLSEKCYIFGAKGVYEPLRGLIGKSKAPYEYGGTYNLSGIYAGDIRRTSVKAEVCGRETDGDSEKMSIRITNTGDMPALFADIKPVHEYMPELYIDRNFVTVPVGESRVVNILSENNDGTSLRLGQVGFSVECFNADRVDIAPDETAILLIGRKDGTTQGYMRNQSGGCVCINAAKASCAADEVPYLIDGSFEVLFNSDTDKTAKLMLNLCDSDNNGLSTVTVKVNSFEKVFKLKPGAGVQNREPWRLAYPETLDIEIPKGTLCIGENRLSVSVSNGWITLDSISICKEEQ